MQGVHAFEPKAQATIDLESFVGGDHFLRRIDRVLDLSSVRELTADRYARGKGRPSIDPEVFFRMQLLAYFHGIMSERQLCQDIHDNLAYRWFCRLAIEDDVPDHSSLTRIRDRMGEDIIEAVFRQIVKQCQQKGLVKQQCRVMTDATLIAADASLNSLVHQDPKQAKKEEEAQRQPRGTIDGSAQRKISNRTHRSRTDPDATLAQKRGSPRLLKYKVHQTIDADSRVILDAEVTTGGRHDNQPYVEQLQRVEDRYQVTIDEAIADSGYGSADIIKTLKANGKKTFIPLWHGRSGKNSGTAVGLVYERDHDRIRCPAGKHLYPNPGNYDNRKRYATKSGECHGCPLLATCPTKTRKKAPHVRFVLRPLDQDLYDEIQVQMNEAEFKKIAAERMWKSEGLFAEAKQNHGLSRAKYRGRAKVQIQAYFTATVQNLKRLLFPFYRWLVVCYLSPTRN